MGFVRPTFEEYPNRYCKEQSVIYKPENQDFSYTAADLMAYFGDKDIKNLVVVNPDNPSGNYIPKADLLKLIDWAAQRNIQLLIDESFADFADEEENTLIEQSLLDNNPHLWVMKSISKSYGVPGLRLGVLASGNQEMIAKLKKDVAIWNINSFGEYYLQIAEKYKKDYLRALNLFKQERKRYEAELAKLPGLRVIPSQANYVMAELTVGMTSRQLTKALLLKHNIFIKDLSAKMGGAQYVRLAIRNTEEDDKLLTALKQELK